MNRIRLLILLVAVNLGLPLSSLAQGNSQFDVHGNLDVGWYDMHVGAHKNFGSVLDGAHS